MAHEDADSNGSTAGVQTETVQYRPKYHFSAKANWINDPNGLVYFEGEYHLFYQHNPLGNSWGNISWGHAISTDLLHWEELPIAIPFTKGVMAFSGSAVVDWHNTSGFGVDGNPPLVAIFTGHYTLESGHRQDQRLAYSTDKGRTWTLYQGNPVLDVGLKDFRDPKVFWHTPSHKWVMVLVVPDQFKVQFYGSKDLKSWEYLSDFGPMGSMGGVWEVPELLELPIEDNPGKTHWMLKVDVGEGGLWGGSAAQYFTGQFDGTGFIADESGGVPRWVDYGQDFYAALSWSDLPETQDRTVWTGWMNNWLYARDLPTHPWRGTMSIPRSLRLRQMDNTYHLFQEPIAEIRKLRGEHLSLAEIELSPGILPLPIQGNVIEILAEFEPQTAGDIGLKVGVGQGQETLIGYDLAKQEIYVDRSHSGENSFSEHFTGRHCGPLPLTNNRVRLHVFLDRSSVEVFGNAGHTVISDLIFPVEGSLGLEIFSEGKVLLRSLDIWEL